MSHFWSAAAFYSAVRGFGVQHYAGVSNGTVMCWGHIVKCLCLQPYDKMSVTYLIMSAVQPCCPLCVCCLNPFTVDNKAGNSLNYPFPSCEILIDAQWWDMLPPFIYSPLGMVPPLHCCWWWKRERPRQQLHKKNQPYSYHRNQLWLAYPPWLYFISFCTWPRRKKKKYVKVELFYFPVKTLGVSWVLWESGRGEDVIWHGGGGTRKTHCCLQRQRGARRQR